MMSPEDNGKDKSENPPEENPEQETGPEESESGEDSSEEESTDDSAEGDDGDSEEESGDASLVKQESEDTPPEKPRKSRRRGFIDFLIVLVLAGLGGGEYLLYKKQKAERELTARNLAGIEHKIQALSSRKPQAPAPVTADVPAEIQGTIESLTAQIEELKGQVEEARNQAEETRNRLQGEIEQLQSAPPPAAPPVEEEPAEEEPVEEEPPAEETHAETHESESHDADGEAHPEEDFIAFVENMFRIVGEGIKDGFVFVVDTLSGLAGGSEKSS